MIPDSVIAFIRSNIKSIWALELLLLVSSTERRWTSAELSESLRASVPLVDEILALFIRRGLITEISPGMIRYEPRNSVAVAQVAELARLYAERPLAVVKEIVAAPQGSIQSFVAAFRVKGD